MRIEHCSERVWRRLQAGLRMAYVEQTTKLEARCDGFPPGRCR